MSLGARLQHSIPLLNPPLFRGPPTGDSRVQVVHLWDSLYARGLWSSRECDGPRSLWASCMCLSGCGSDARQHAVRCTVLDEDMILVALACHMAILFYAKQLCYPLRRHGGISHCPKRWGVHQASSLKPYSGTQIKTSFFVHVSKYDFEHRSGQGFPESMKMTMIIRTPPRPCVEDMNRKNQIGKRELTLTH